MQAAVLLVFAAVCLSRVGGIPRNEFFDTGSQVLRKGNAVSSDAVELEEGFAFFGQRQTAIYVSTDGLLSFGARVTQGTPQSFPWHRTLIAPFWANADTSRVGNVYYMQTRAAHLLQRATGEIQSAFSSQFLDFVPTVLFVATWDQVGRANSPPGQTNTFQAVLATDGTMSFVIFLYADDMQWTNDDVPNETVPGAQVGFNPGGGHNGFSLPTSLTRYTLDIATSSNVGREGVWIFRVDNLQIELPGVIIGLEEVSYLVQEGVGSVSICARLIGEETEASVTVETQDILSLADRDYTDTTLELDFSDDVNRRCFSIDVEDDDVLETDETFAVVLTTENTDVTLLPQMALVVIKDNDRVTVGHLQPRWLVTESEEAAFLCVQAHGLTERPIEVRITTQGGNATVGQDYQFVSRRLTIEPGSSPSKCGSYIPIIDNQVLEQTESVNILLETNDGNVTIDSPVSVVIIQDNDGALVFAGFEQVEYIVQESSSSVEVCIGLTGAISHPITISIRSISYLRTATVGSDYVDIREDLVFFPQNSTLPRCVSITILEDQVLESDEAFFVVLSSFEVALTPRQARIIIQDNDDVFVQLEQYEYVVNELGQLRVCATLTGTLESFAPISIIPIPGTATANEDYRPRRHDLSFRPPPSAGEPVRPVCANIFIINDFLYENHTENFFIELRSNIRSVHTDNRRATVYIEDNDFMFVIFSRTISEIEEGQISGFICFYYPNGILATNITLSLTAVDGTAIGGSDYEPFSEELVFRPLNEPRSTNTFCARLQTMEDNIFEGNENLTLVLSTRSERVLIGESRTEANTQILPITILDNDVVTVKHKQLAYDVREDVGSVRVCAVLTGQTENNVGVLFTTMDGNGAAAGVDYDSVDMETVLRPGEEACVSVPIRDNQVLSSTRRKSFSVVLAGANSLIRVEGEATATVTITDDDAVTVSVVQPEYSVGEGDGTVSVCVTKTGEANFGITGHLVSAGQERAQAEASVDYTLTEDGSSFTFVAGRVGGTRCVEIPIVEDSLVEGNEAFQVQVALDDGNRPVVIDRLSTTIMIEDNDVAMIGFQEAEYSIGEEDGPLRVCVDLEGNIERDIALELTTLPMAAEAGVDYVALSTPLVFQPSESSVCTEIFILNDAFVEETESFLLLLNATHSQVTFSTGQAVVTVVDDDSIGVRLEQSVYSVTEDVNFINLCVSIEGHFSVDVPVTVSTEAVTAEGDEDYLDISRTLLFSSDTLRGCVNIEIRDDDLLEDSETFDVLLSSPNPAVRYTTNQSARVYITDNDRVTLGLRQSVYTVVEGTGAVEVCADLLGGLGKVVPIMLESLDAEGVTFALGNSDYEALSTVFEFQPSQSATHHSRCFNISIQDDNILEAIESFTISLTTSVENVDIGVAVAQVDILDNDGVSVSWETPEMEVSEEMGFVEVCARLTGVTKRVVSLGVTDQPDTAQEERDYGRPPVQGLRFGPSDNVTCIIINLVSDTILEGDEGFSLLMTSSDPAVALGRATTYVTIQDDDTVQVGFEQEQFTVDESDLRVSICVTLQGSIERNVTVTLSTEDEDTARGDEDYLETSHTLLFTSDTLAGCVDVQIRDDDLLEDLESFDVLLTSTNPAVRYSTNQSARVYITDNDRVTLGLRQSVYTVVEGTGAVEVCADLLGGLGKVVPIMLESSDAEGVTFALGNTDYEALSAVFEFQPSQSVTHHSRCFNISIQDDNILEAIKSFTISLTTSVENVDIGVAMAQVDIIDNDGVSVSWETPEMEVSEEMGFVEVCARLTGITERVVSLGVTDQPDTAQEERDYGRPPVQGLHFGPSDNVTCIIINLVSDTILEGDEGFFLLMTSSDPAVALGRATTYVTIQDDDTVQVEFEQEQFTVDESDLSVSICVRLQGSIERNVTVTLSTEDEDTARGDEDYLETSHTLIFTSDTLVGCVDVQIHDDDLLEDLESFDVLLTSTNPAVRYSTNQSARVYIADNDRVTLGLRQSVYTVVEGTGAVEVCADLLGGLGKVVTIMLESSDTGGVAVAQGNTDYEALSTVFEFQPSQSVTHHSRCFNISIQDDNILEAIESFTISLTTSVENVDISIAMAQVDIIDNDGVSVSWETPEIEVSEEMGFVEVCARLTGVTKRVVSLGVTDQPDTAQEERDYGRPPVQGLRFGPSDNVTCIIINLVSDTILEGDEGFSLLMTSSDPAVALGRDTTYVTIQDDDTVQVEFEQEQFTVDESDLSVSICVRLQGSIERNVTVTLSTEDEDTARGNEDYLETSHTLLFTSDTLVGCVNVEIHDDDLLEDLESFNVLLTSTDPAVRYTTNQSARVYIADNDRVTLGLRQSVYTVVEGTGAVEVCADLLGGLGKVVPIMLESLDTGGVAVAQGNTDYEALSAVFEFQPSQSVTRHSRCFNISIQDDSILEDIESFTISLTTSVENVDISIAMAQVDIIDNDGVSVSWETPEKEVSEEMGFVEVCARLTGIAERVVSLGVTDQPDTAQEERDYRRPSVQGLRFGPSESVTCTSINLVSDTILEGDEGFSLLMTSSDPAVTLGQTTTTYVTIRDDDTVQVVFEQEQFTVEESDIEVSICVMLQGSIERSITVMLSTKNGDSAVAEQDYSPLTEELTFVPPAENPTHCITISLTDDTKVEETEEFLVELTTSDGDVIFPLNTIPVVITDSDVVCPGGDTSGPWGVYEWEETQPFVERQAECAFGPVVEGAIGTRTCGEGGVWEDPRLRECRGDLDDIFARLAMMKFSKDYLAELAVAILQATLDNETKPEYLSIVARYFREYSQLVEDDEILVDTESFGHILKIVDIIQKWPISVLQRNSSDIVHSTEGISVGLVEEEDGLYKYIGSAQHVAFISRTTDVGVLQDSGVGITFSPVPSPSLNFTTTNPAVTVTDDTTAVTSFRIVLKEDSTAVLYTPASVFSKVESSRVGQFFSVYDTAVLFPLDKTPNVDQLHDAIGTVVVAATVAGEEISRLNERILFALQLQSPNFTKPRCVSWVFGREVWTQDGCKLESNEDGVVTCSCDHLTNFAVLVDISGRTDTSALSEDAELAIEIVSLVGVVLSLVGLILTVITLVAFKKLRQRDSTKFRVQLCIAMALMMVVFIVGIDRTENRYVCISVSALLHYFTLASVLWMGAEALLMFRKIVFVFSQVSKKFIVIVTLTCWLLPLPAVIVPVVLDQDHVISEDYCFISHTVVFFGAFLGPIFAILLFNFIIFVTVVLIICSHSRKKNKAKERSAKRKSTLRTLASLTGVMVLFGLTWVFAAFTVKSAAVVFQFLFAVFNSLQGFFIFMFFVVLSKDSRELWLLACGCKKQKLATQSTVASNVGGGSRVSSRAGSLRLKFPEFDDSDMEAEVKNKPFNYWDVQYIVPPRLRWNVSFSSEPPHSRQVSAASLLPSPQDQAPHQLGKPETPAGATTLVAERPFQYQEMKRAQHATSTEIVDADISMALRTSTPIGGREDSSFTQKGTGISIAPLTLSAGATNVTTDDSSVAGKIEEGDSSPEMRNEKLFHSLMLGRVETDNADSGLESQSSSNDHLQVSTTPPSEEPVRCASAGAELNGTDI